MASTSPSVFNVPRFTSACRVYFPTGTLPPASAILLASFKFSSPVTFVPLSFRDITTTWLFRTFALVPSTTSPSASSWSICFCAAEKNKSHSYPSSICVRSELSALNVIFTSGWSSLYSLASSVITVFRLAAMNTWISVSFLLSSAAFSSVFLFPPHAASETIITPARRTAAILFTIWFLIILSLSVLVFL